MSNAEKIPAVSVIMPTFNRGDYIQEAVESVLAQTFRNFELIIIDDGSTDHTQKIIAPYLSDNCFYYGLSHVGNISRIRNFGLQKARGEYIAYIDSDDVWTKEKLSQQIHALQTNPQIGLIFTNITEFQAGCPANEIRYERLLPHKKISFKDLLNNTLAIYPSSILYRKSCLTRTGLHDESFVWNDMGFITRLTAYYGAMFLPDKLTAIRKHNNNISSVLKSEAVGYRDMIKTTEQLYYANFLDHGQYLKISAQFCYSMGIMHQNANEFNKAMEAYRKAMAFRPVFIKASVRYLVAKLNLLIS